MGTTRDDGSQQSMWVSAADLPQGRGHPFYELLNRIFEAAGFDAFVEGLCARFYTCNEEIVRRTFPEGKLDKTRRPDSAKQRLFQRKIMEVWKTVLEGIDVFADALDDRDESGDERRREIRRNNLLGKPVAQECLVRAFVRLTGAPTNMAADEACKRLNRLPWSMTEENLEKWQRVLWNGGTDGRIITKNRKLATALIAWAAGERIGEEAQAELLADYRRQFPEGERDRGLPALS